MHKVRVLLTGQWDIQKHNKCFMPRNKVFSVVKQSVSRRETKCFKP